MRTTINLDDDVLNAARAIARAEGRGVGAVLSGLVRRALAPADVGGEPDDGFPVFRVPSGSPPLTDEMVQAALEVD